jgi:4'-phosphopantetheinyl transferase
MGFRRIAAHSSWPAAEGTPPLQRSAVHVWKAALDIADTEVTGARKLLTAEETARADRFRFEKDRSAFIAARGILRTLLGRYLGLRPGDLRFVYGRHGKPELSNTQGAPLIRFNLSHSHGLALFAFAPGFEVGVDIEYLRQETPADAIAGRFFSPAEVEELRALPPAARQAAFFACWCRKEAFLKANGRGLSFGLDRVEVSVTPGVPAALKIIGNSPEEAAGWSLSDLPAGREYAAALAARKQAPEISLYEWTGSFGD